LSDEKNYNGSIAAIEKAARAAMEADLQKNPAMKRQYNDTFTS
jgi:hypothetical protein